MPGQNAFAFNGTAFVPSDRNLTAGMSVFSPAPIRKSVTYAYKIQSGVPASQFWQGFPPAANTLTFRNVRTGTFPNLNNSIWLDWECESSTLIASFDVFVKIGNGAYSPIANVSAATRTYNYGTISADTQYSFYIRTNGISGLTTTSQAATTSLPSPALVSVLSTSKTNTTATVSWTVGSGVFQKFFVYDTNSLIATVNATETGTSFSYTRNNLSQGVAYNFRVYGQNRDGFTSGYQEANVTTDVMPVPTVSWESTSATLYSGFRVTWSGSSGVSYQPQYSPDNVTWYSLGGVQSGAGVKYTDTLSPAYADDHFIRLYVYNGEVDAYTSTRSVTPGRPLITSTTPAAWNAEGSNQTYSYAVSTPASISNGTSGQQRIIWGDENAIQVNSDANTERRVMSVTVKAEKVTGSTGSLTSNTRRVIINLDGSASRYTGFDGTSATETYNTGHTTAYVGDRSARTDYYGVRDQNSIWSSANARWQYSDGTANFWASDRTKFTITVTYRERTWSPESTTTTQTQVDSSYT